MGGGPQAQPPHGHSKSPGTKAYGPVLIGRPGGPGQALVDAGISQASPLGSQTLPSPRILGWGVAVGGDSAFILPACSQIHPTPHTGLWDMETQDLTWLWL